MGVAEGTEPHAAMRDFDQDTFYWKALWRGLMPCEVAQLPEGCCSQARPNVGMTVVHYVVLCTQAVYWNALQCSDANEQCGAELCSKLQL